MPNALVALYSELDNDQIVERLEWILRFFACYLPVEECENFTHDIREANNVLYHLKDAFEKIEC